MLFFIRREELGAVMDRTHKCAVNGSPGVGGPEGAAGHAIIHASQTGGTFCSINVSLW